MFRKNIPNSKKQSTDIMVTLNIPGKLCISEITLSFSPSLLDMSLIDLRILSILINSRLDVVESVILGSLDAISSNTRQRIETKTITESKIFHPLLR